MEIKYAIIGSRALKYWCHNFREPKDLDIIIDSKDLEKFIESEEYLNIIYSITNIKSENLKYSGSKKRSDSCLLPIINKEDGSSVLSVEFLFSDSCKGYQWIINKVNENNENNQNNQNFKYATLDMLYSLKKGHIHYGFKFNDKKFEKHIKDLIFIREVLLKKNASSKYLWTSITNDDIYYSGNDSNIEKFPDLTDMHYQDTGLRLGKIKTPKLYNVNTNSFFGRNNFKTYYIHDNIHKAIAHLPGFKPAYELMQDKNNNPQSVNCIKDLWDNMNLQCKQWCTLEEAYVIALERKILPQLFGDSDENMTPEEAFKWALKRICTNLCSGWFRWFSTINYNNILLQYDCSYVDKFFKNIINIEKY